MTSLDDSLAAELRGRSAVVTGGTGLIGRQVVRLLADAGAAVRSVSLDRIEVDSRAEHVLGDLTDFGFCKEVTRDIDFVFHVAGIKGSVEVTKSRPASFFVPLLMMNTNLLEAARLNGARKVVYTSTIGAYSTADALREDDYDETKPPMDVYPGWAKRMAELQVRTYRIQYGLENFAIVRPCNVYGPGDNFDSQSAMVIPSLMARIRRGEDPLVVWGDGSAVRDFAYAADVAVGVILACHKGTQGRFVNLGSGVGTSIRELVETLASFIDFRFTFDPTRGTSPPRRVMDISLAREMLGYHPTTSLREGLEKTWNWFLANPDEHFKKQNYFRA